MSKQYEMSGIEEACRLAGDIAFEHDFGDGCPALWRLSMFRHWGGRKVRSVNWYRSQEAAEVYATRRQAEGDELISLDCYVRTPQPPSPTASEGSK
jgi:hypothetical protein